MSIEELERAVEFHDYQYWVLANPVISDEDYDLLVRRLEELKPDSEVLRRVGGGAAFPAEGFRDKVEHESPMLSLDKCYDEDKFFAWLKTTVGRTVRHAVQEGGTGLTRYAAFGEVEREDDLPGLAAELEVTVSPKIDGVAASLKYDSDGNVVLAATRGDGMVGEDFTLNARLISGIPWTVEMGDVEVRGEVYMRRSVFREKYAERFPNPRNLTAGTLKQKESNRAQLLDLSFFAYDLVGGGVASEEEKRELLARLGFIPVDSQLAKAREVPGLYEEALAQRDAWDFDADGLVVRLNDLGLQGILGVTAHHPRYAIAFKFQGDTGITTLAEVEWSVSRSSTITPVAIVEPVFLSGARVSRSTLHNIREFGKLALKRGDSVQIKRRGDVIPKIEGSLGGGTEPFRVPVVCPSCESEAVLASPQVFVAGARLARFGDRQQLSALIARQRSIAGRAGILSPADTCNSAARREGDIHFRKVLTWKRGDPEARKEVTQLLQGLPSVRHMHPEVVVLMVLDPSVRYALATFELVVGLVESQRLDLKILLVSDSRREGGPGNSAEYDALVEAGRSGRFFAELAGAAPALEPLLDSNCRLKNGDFSREFLLRCTDTGYALSDDVLYCSGPETCRDAALGVLEHFIQTLGVDGFGRKIIENLYDAGLLTAREDFFRLSLSRLADLERLGDVLAAKLLDNVQRGREPALSVFLQALGVEELARHVSTLLEREYGTMERVLELTEDDLMKHESIAFGIAHQVVHGLRRSRPEVERLLEYVEIEVPASAAEMSGLPLSGRSFVFTGKMKTMQRKAAQHAVKELGGEVPSGVTTALTCLVVGDEGSPLFGEGTKGGKIKRAEKYNRQGAGIEIISETEFLVMLQEFGS